MKSPQQFLNRKSRGEIGLAGGKKKILKNRPLTSIKQATQKNK